MSCNGSGTGIPGVGNGTAAAAVGKPVYYTLMTTAPGVIVLPALAGLGAPWWDLGAAGLMALQPHRVHAVVPQSGVSRRFRRPGEVHRHTARPVSRR